MKREEIFIRFLSLVRTHFKEEFNIGFYSEHLGVSSDELSEIIWEKSESTLSDWLDTMQKRA
ncbi:MAG: hypothetical protein LBQ60_19830 [Bacteroidales bacterium]|jgi:hypothetical protein|nr:hypothetical protein [Bacteroidales bacterium]